MAEYQSDVLVEYVQHAGDDMMVVDAARVSYAKERDGNRGVSGRDEKLIHYLAEHHHMTPFEHCFLTVNVEIPVFTRGHVVRHRTFSYNEISRRYTSEGLKVWKPELWCGQSRKNHQSSVEPLSHTVQVLANTTYEEAIEGCLYAYNRLLELGVSREQARAVLPQGLYTRFYMSGNLRNWHHFYQLRSDAAHAQEQDVQMARQLEDIILMIWPYSWSALKGEPIAQALEQD